MIELLIVLIGSVLAGIWDLKTTEVPDEVPYLMIAFSVFSIYMRSMLSGDFSLLAYSLAIGTIVLLVGLLGYKTGKWGEADAWIFAAIFYALPFFNGELFVIPFVLNLILVTFVYTIIYTIALGFKYRVWGKFWKEVRKEKTIILSVIAILFVFVCSLFEILLIQFAWILCLIFLLYVFWLYAKFIEKKVFTRRISTKKLKPGDVLKDMIWRGLTEKEVRKIRRTKKYVVIKDGIRFVPVFPITLVITLLFGNVLLVFMSFCFCLHLL